MTKPPAGEGDSLLAVPRIAFAQLRLDNWSAGPTDDEPNDLPYSDMGHLRDCLMVLGEHKRTKTVRRSPSELLFRTVNSGFYIGSYGEGIAFYAMPSRNQLETIYNQWWAAACNQ
jgi:hypothetical protein